MDRVLAASPNEFLWAALASGDVSKLARSAAFNANPPCGTGISVAVRIFSITRSIKVIRGDMSLVGPRPYAIAMKAGDRPYGEAVERYPHLHRVKPGITGWAPGQWVLRRGRYARKGARPGRARSLLH